MAYFGEYAEEERYEFTDDQQIGWFLVSDWIRRTVCQPSLNQFRFWDKFHGSTELSTRIRDCDICCKVSFPFITRGWFARCESLFRRPTLVEGKKAHVSLSVEPVSTVSSPWPNAFSYVISLTLVWVTKVDENDTCTLEHRCIRSIKLRPRIRLRLSSACSFFPPARSWLSTPVAFTHRPPKFTCLLMRFYSINAGTIKKRDAKQYRSEFGVTMARAILNKLSCQGLAC